MQTVITTDALELMVQMTQAINGLAEIVKEFMVKVDEVKTWMIQPEYYTFEQAAIILNISEATLRKSRAEGVIGGRTPMPPSVNIGDCVRFPRTDMAEWGVVLPRHPGQK